MRRRTQDCQHPALTRAWSLPVNPQNGSHSTANNGPRRCLNATSTPISSTSNVIAASLQLRDSLRGRCQPAHSASQPRQPYDSSPSRVAIKPAVHLDASEPGHCAARRAAVECPSSYPCGRSSLKQSVNRIRLACRREMGAARSRARGPRASFLHAAHERARVTNRRPLRSRRCAPIAARPPDRHPGFSQCPMPGR